MLKTVVPNVSLAPTKLPHPANLHRTGRDVNGHVTSGYLVCDVVNNNTCSEQQYLGHWHRGNSSVNHLTHTDVDTSVFGGTRPRTPGRHVQLRGTTERR